MTLPDVTPVILRAFSMRRARVHSILYPISAKSANLWFLRYDDLTILNTVYINVAKWPAPETFADTAGCSQWPGDYSVQSTALYTAASRGCNLIIALRSWYQEAKENTKNILISNLDTVGQLRFQLRRHPPSWIWREVDIHNSWSLEAHNASS